MHQHSSIALVVTMGINPLPLLPARKAREICASELKMDSNTRTRIMRLSIKDDTRSVRKYIAQESCAVAPGIKPVTQVSCNQLLTVKNQKKSYVMPTLHSYSNHYRYLITDITAPLFIHHLPT